METFRPIAASSFLTIDRKMPEISFSAKKLTRPKPARNLQCFYREISGFFVILPVMTGVRVSVETNSVRVCFFTYVYKFSRKNMKVEFWPKIPDNIPTRVGVPLSSTQTPSVQHLSSTSEPHLFSPQNPSVQHQNPLSSTPKKSNCKARLLRAFLVWNRGFFVSN